MQMIRVLEPVVIDDVLRRVGELVLVPDDWDDPTTEVRKAPHEMAAVQAGKRERLEVARAEQDRRRAEQREQHGAPGDTGGHGNADNPPKHGKNQGS